MKTFDLGTVKTVISCEYKDVEDAIAEFYGLTEYSILEAEEGSNDTAMVMYIDGKLTGWALGDALMLLNTKKPNQWRTSAYLNYMASKGAIQTGEYIISISW